MQTWLGGSLGFPIDTYHFRDAGDKLELFEVDEQSDWLAELVDTTLRSGSKQRAASL